MQDVTPTIKGIFVNSHIKILEKKKGSAARAQLEERFGKPINFRNSDNVPVRDEVAIIEHVMDILEADLIPPDKREFEAGRLHFRNFSTTPLARIIFSMFRTNFKLMMMSAPNIAGHVFRGVKFMSEDLGSKGVKVTMVNNDYPLDHFRGLFQEWMDYAGLKGEVTAQEPSPDRYEYVMKWE